jgi:nitrate/nitrite transport system permease protein
MAVWILSQMKRWGYIKGDMNYKDIAERVYLITDARKHMAERHAGAQGQLRQVQGHGQGVRPDEGRRLREQLRHPEGLTACRHEERALEKPAAVGAAVRPVRRRVVHRHAAEGKRQQTAAQDEYAALMGKGAAKSGGSPAAAGDRQGHRHPPVRPVQGQRAQRQGHRIQLGYSLGRVRHGLRCWPSLVALPLGFLIGMSPLLYRRSIPFIQVLKPISPLAWMPLALYTIKDSGILRHLRHLHLLGVADADQHRLRRRQRAPRLAERRAHAGSETAARRLPVILPAAAPTILTGMRISIGIAWLVIVAAEMLVGGTGIGYFVWNEWNNLSLTNVITAILLIGWSACCSTAASPGSCKISW